MYGLIYLLTNTITNMQYVGQTIQTLDARCSKHVSDAKAGEATLIANAIQRYGAQAFTRQVLEDGVPFSNLDTVERYYIMHYSTLHPYGYNERLP